MHDRPVLLGSLLIVVAASLFAMLGPLARAAEAAGLTPLGYTTWRALLGTASVAAFVVAGGTAGAVRAGFAASSPRHRATLLVVGVAALALNAALFIAYGLVPVALALVLFYVYPAGIAAADLALGHERPSPRRLLALGLALGGAALTLVGGIDVLGPIDPAGIGLALGAAVCQVTFVTLSRNGYPTLPATGATLAVLGMTALGGGVLALVVDGPEAVALPVRDLAPWPAILVGGILAAGVPTILFLEGIRRIGATRTGILMLLEPVVGVTLAAVLLGEALGPVQVAGGALVLAGALLLQGSSPAAAEGEAAPVA